MFGTLKRVPNILEVFSRKPPIRPQSKRARAQLVPVLDARRLGRHIGTGLIFLAGPRLSGGNMAIRRLIASGSYKPEEIRAMTVAYDVALIVLRLNDKDDPITELLAKSIAAVVATGERKPGQIATKAIDALGIKRPQS